MKCPAILATEKERLKALAQYGLGSDRPLPSLDSVVKIAAQMFDMPVAAVNMIGSDQVFFAASIGVNASEVDLRRDVSFCAHVINQRDVMVVPDTQLDERFHDNPLVTGATNLRFYAGVPLLSPEGHALGALCVIDGKPRPEFSQEDANRLCELAKMAGDRLELRRIEISTEQARRPFAEFAKNSPTAVVWFNERGEVVAWNHAAALLYGYGLEEGAGRSVETLVVEEDRALVRELIAKAAAAGTMDGLSMPKNIQGLRKDGSEFLLGLSLFCWHENGSLTFNAHLQDLTARRRKAEELYRLASTDILTGLANRTNLYRQAEHALVCALPMAVLMIDLDGFKDVNDTLGHGVGDAILQEIAHRLKQLTQAHSDSTVARIGGDEFAVLLPGFCDEALALSLAHQIIATIAEPIDIGGHEVRVAASCGLALAPCHGQEALELIGSADLALFKAKNIGRGKAFVFVNALRMEAAARRLYNIELHRAVNAGEFELFYQPQIRLGDGSLAGAEALLRWRHPERGLLSPAAFLPALEGGPLAAVVGAWVLDEACAQAALWRRYGAHDFRMGVNLFSAQFQVGNLLEEVASALARHDLPASALELEVTENIVLEQDERILEALQNLRELGVGIAFDDFGTGYASLSLLKQYPLSRIKIDRSFVQNLQESKRDSSVIRAILDMARSFDLETIAEGIETDAQYTLLRDFGCEEGQGYFFNRPISAQEFAETFGINIPIRLAV